jgi:hypothetical protein
MKQTNMMRWMEAAEARSVWMLAEEHPVRATVTAASPGEQLTQTGLAKLRGQLCLGDATRQRLARLYRPRAAA